MTTETPLSVDTEVRQRSTAWIAMACAAAVVAVGFAVATVVLATAGEERVGESADSSAEAACGLLDQVPDEGFDPFVDADREKVNPDLNRIRSASTLAFLAWDLDDGYQDLHKTLETLGIGASDLSRTKSDEFVEALRDGRDACAESGF